MPDIIILSNYVLFCIIFKFSNSNSFIHAPITIFTSVKVYIYIYIF